MAQARSHMTSCQEDYLVRELLILAWGASVQHVKLYKSGVKSNSREVRLFRGGIFEHLRFTLVPSYKYQVPESEHYKNIDDLIDFANNAGTHILGKDGYKYGVAQKLLNLTLKYCWCLGLLAEPPHCPVDRVVIDKTKFKGDINWTEITEKSEYEKVIREIRRLADTENLSIANWELSYYRRRE